MSESHLQTLKNIYSGILDLVYPPFCLVCGKAGADYLCQECIDEIVLIGKVYCRRCGMPTENRCKQCEGREYYFNSACSAGIYEGALKSAIHAFKFDFRIVLAEPLAELMIKCFQNTSLVGKLDLAVPIPIHHSRMVERGFNQAEELASRLCGRIHLPLAKDILIKRIKTPHQVDLPQDLRCLSAQGAFTVKSAPAIFGKRILLIDDVFTTGSTLNEAARVLKEAGAASVHAYTLAKSL